MRVLVAGALVLVGCFDFASLTSGGDAGHGDDGSAGIAFRAGSQQQPVTSVDSLTILTPVGVQEGDLLLLVLYTNLVNTMVTPLDMGWIAQADLRNDPACFHSWWYYRWASAAEPASYSFRFSWATTASAALVAYSGVAPVNPIDASGPPLNITGNPFVAQSISTMVANTMLVAMFVNDSGAGANWTALTTDVRRRAQTGLVAVFDAPQAAPAATAEVSVTCSMGGSGSVELVALTPAP